MSKNSNIAHSDTLKDNSYEKTLKSNFLFGGIKLFQVALSVIKIKIVAVILGPTGMGLQSLMTSTLASLFQFTTFGIFQSSVRDISFNSQRSANKTADIIKTLNGYGITPQVVDPWASARDAMHEYGVTLTQLQDVKDADCIIVAVAHTQFKELSLEDIKAMFRADGEKVLIDVKGLYSVEQLQQSGFKWWRL